MQLPMNESTRAGSVDRHDLRWVKVALAAISLWMALWLALPAGSFALVILSDVSGLLLIAAALAGTVRNARRSQGNARIFWWLMASGTLLWSVNQAAWVYLQVLTRQGVPDLFW